ncbi:MAG: TatD family hydrolase [Candidatus Thorarchaeota archaeon]
MNRSSMIDTHCHLAEDLFSDDRDDVIRQASLKGIQMISSAITEREWELNMRLAKQYPEVYSSIGVEPTNLECSSLAEQFIRTNMVDLVSIGEVGLDHFKTRDHRDREKQEKVFIEMIQLADDLKLPLQIHSRSAGRAALEVLYKENADRVHMHAFDGKSSLARNASYELGYYFSIPTSVVRSPQKQKLVKAINIERLLIETDSPVLAPEKGERNTPLNLPFVLNEISQILHRDKEELREIILENTLRLYSNIKS